MKLKALLVLVCSLFAFSMNANAVVDNGVIQEIVICSTGKSGSSSLWRNTVQFKVNNKWYAIYGNHGGNGNNYDRNISASLLFMAYSQKISINLQASTTWEGVFEACGVTSTNGGAGVVHEAAGDYLKLSR